ncbi:MAG: hypothetical protein Ct9H300mP31_20560 [Acidimicrobiaceae bacterium]|nr:MAG: hypothetical protein Ct9H300mP31_20560 [Acidimicrobiaceae bacterium]
MSPCSPACQCTGPTGWGPPGAGKGLAWSNSHSAAGYSSCSRRWTSAARPLGDLGCPMKADGSLGAHGPAHRPQTEPIPPRSLVPVTHRTVTWPAGGSRSIWPTRTPPPGRPLTGSADSWKPPRRPLAFRGVADWSTGWGRVGPQGDHVPTSAGVHSLPQPPAAPSRLPALATDLPTRAFVPGDSEAFLAVNNLAFDWHPDQGG